MKLTSKQLNELEVWKYFMPRNTKWAKENATDIQKFFEWSQEGRHKSKTYGDLSYFEALREGKSWAGIHMGMFEEGVLDGSMPYVEILSNPKIIKRKWWQFWKSRTLWKQEPTPRPVVDFMKKEMFKGIDAELIEKCYQEILTSKV